MTVAGRGRVRAVSAYDTTPLTGGWTVCGSSPGAIRDPAALRASSVPRMPATVPSTVAEVLQCAGAWSLGGPARDFDADDWWYETTFRIDPAEAGEQLWLCLDGLATVAEVWLNDELVLATSNMFIGHECRIDAIVRRENHLAIAFRSLQAALSARRPRPRWRVPMISHQQLRWFRTTLLGRTPGWSPPAAAVGPWRDVRLERRRVLQLSDVRVRPHGGGAVDVSCVVDAFDGTRPLAADLVLTRADRTVRVPLAPIGDGTCLAGRAQVPGVERWWPHTHGPSPLYDAQLIVRHRTGTVDAQLGSIGFRSVSAVTTNGAFELHVNGAPVFSRGACWTPLDVVSLRDKEGALPGAIAQVADAGMNMLRLSGTMVYPNDAFLDLCDARGVMVWHDFMFANMDYPDGDPGFCDMVDREVQQHLARLQGRACVTVLCGNSEGEQQAALWGASRDRWASPLFHERIAAHAGAYCPDVPYVPSSATGGAFPHQGNVGSSSYYGVGAYLRPVEDARRAEVRFASECLAFANLGEPSTENAATFLPSAWKARTPRDVGAGWDFDDVRDHYLERMFRVDPVSVRYADPARYLQLGRVVTGEVMAAVFAEWRRRRSVTRGGLVWFLRDLWDCAGWGVIDAAGTPKPAWYYLKRALAPLAVFVSDEGTNGLAVHLVNDGERPADGTLTVTAYRGDVQVAHGATPRRLPARGALELNAVSLFEGFLDLSYAYRFGPASHDVVVASWSGGDGEQRHAFHFVHGLPHAKQATVGLTATARQQPDGCYLVDVRAEQFAQSVRIFAPGWRANDNYFHMAPRTNHRVRLVRVDGAASGPFRAECTALNADAAVAVHVDAEG